jgi:hypothetical protein
LHILRANISVFSVRSHIISTQDGTTSIQEAGTELFNTIKTKVETIITAQDGRTELQNQIGDLRESNVRLEEKNRSCHEKISDQEGQLSTKQVQLESCQEKLIIKTAELDEVRLKLQEISVLQLQLNESQTSNGELRTQVDEVTQQLEMSQSDVEAATAEVLRFETAQSELRESLQAANNKISKFESEHLACVAAAKASLDEAVKQALEKQKLSLVEDKKAALKTQELEQLQRISTLKRRGDNAEIKLSELQVEIDKWKTLATESSDKLARFEAENATIWAAESTRHKEQLQTLKKDYEALAVALRIPCYDIAQIKIALADYEAKTTANLVQTREMEQAFAEYKQTANSVEQTVTNETITRLEKELKVYVDSEAKIRLHIQSLEDDPNLSTVELVKRAFSTKPHAAAPYRSRSTSIDRVLGTPLAGPRSNQDNQANNFPRKSRDRLLQAQETENLIENFRLDSSHAASASHPSVEKGKKGSSKHKTANRRSVVNSSRDFPPAEVPDSQGQEALQAQCRVAQRPGIPPSPVITRSRGSFTQTTQTTEIRIRELRTYQQSSNVKDSTAVIEDLQTPSRSQGSTNTSGSESSPLTDIEPVTDFIKNNPNGDHSQLLKRQRSIKGFNIDPSAEKKHMNAARPKHIPQYHSGSGGTLQELRGILKSSKGSENSPQSPNALWVPSTASKASSKLNVSKASPVITLPARGTKPFSHSRMGAPSNKNVGPQQSSSSNAFQAELNSSKYYDIPSSPVVAQPRRNSMKRMQSNMTDEETTEPPRKQQRVSLPHQSKHVSGLSGKQTHMSR